MEVEGELYDENEYVEKQNKNRRKHSGEKFYDLLTVHTGLTQGK